MGHLEIAVAALRVHSYASSANELPARVRVQGVRGGGGGNFYINWQRSHPATSVVTGW